MTAIFALESHIDRLAEELCIDPLEFRLKNYAIYASDSHEITDGAIEPLVTISEQEKEIPYSSNQVKECMNLVAKEIGWERRRTLNSNTQSSIKRGIGLAALIMNTGVALPPYAAEAEVVIHNDGTINLFIGVVDIGAGQFTIFSMIAAEELGVEIDDITVVGGDTKDTGYAPSSHASRLTAELGPAVLQAAAEARQKIFELAAPMLGGKTEEIRSKNRDIYVKSDPSISTSFHSVCSKIDPNQPIRGRGSRAPNPSDNIRFAVFGAQAVELEVDVDVGAVNILRVAAAHDVGRAINPKLTISQVYGGIEFGVGISLSEEGIFDTKSGKMLNNNYQQYRMPTSFDMPNIQALIVEGEDPYFAYSAKGIGEETSVPTAAAIRNALYDALGIWFNHLPITPDKIINAIQETKGKGVG
jgi:xanthine dehydrogenase molybdenum-binding subunit